MIVRSRTKTSRLETRIDGIFIYVEENLSPSGAARRGVNSNIDTYVEPVNVLCCSRMPKSARTTRRLHQHEKMSGLAEPLSIEPPGPDGGEFPTRVPLRI